MKTLGPAMTLMAFAMLCVGILLTDAVGEHLHSNAEISPIVRQELTSSFGSVGGSMLSMYMAISAGRSWGEQYDLLEQVNPQLALAFVCFLLVIVLVATFRVIGSWWTFRYFLFFLLGGGEGGVRGDRERGGASSFY